MKINHVKLMPLVVSILVSVSLNAQQTIASAGGNATGSGGSASYTVGQVFYKTANGTNASVADGVQQAYEIQIIVGIEETKELELSLTAFPNPTPDILILKVVSNHLENLQYELVDGSGKLLLSNTLTEAETAIPMANLASAIYFLTVSKGNKVQQSFKIIKK